MKGVDGRFYWPFMLFLSSPYPPGPATFGHSLDCGDRGIYYYTKGLYGLLKIRFIQFETGMEDCAV